MKRKLSKILSCVLASVLTITSVGILVPAAETNSAEQKTFNSKYNSFDFIKENMPTVPELRFKGSSIEDYNKWKKTTQEKIKEIMGISELKIADSQPVLLESKDFPDYTRFKYEINTTGSLYMPFYVLKPKKNLNGKAAIAIHGHGSDGKEGLVGNESNSYKESVEKYRYTYALDLVDKGYTVYVPDLLGAGERTLGIYKDNTAECNDINNALVSLGYSLQGIILLENLRLVDHISGLKYKEIDCIGFSGGGQSALWLTAMSDKINKTIVSGFLHSYKDTLIYNNRCGCNFIPNMWKYVDMGDILALTAQKEIYIETGNQDKLNGERGLTGVYEQIDIANKCFKLFDKEVQLKVCEGSHQWYGSWMDKF